MDWAQVNEHLSELSQPTKVDGSVQYRDQASYGLELWTLSGRQTFALDEANGDKVRMRNYILDVSKKVDELEQSICHWWQIACKRAAAHK